MPFLDEFFISSQWHTVNICVSVRLLARHKHPGCWCVFLADTLTCKLPPSHRVGTNMLTCCFQKECVLLVCAYVCVWFTFCNLMEAPLTPTPPAPTPQVCDWSAAPALGIRPCFPTLRPLFLSRSPLFYSSLPFSLRHMIHYITGLRSELD